MRRAEPRSWSIVNEEIVTMALSVSLPCKVSIQLQVMFERRIIANSRAIICSCSLAVVIVNMLQSAHHHNCNMQEPIAGARYPSQLLQVGAHGRDCTMQDRLS